MNRVILSKINSVVNVITGEEGFDDKKHLPLMLLLFVLTLLIFSY